MERGTGYQISLIGLGILTMAFFAVFIYREVFPQYKEFQNTYVALEEFRASITGGAVPPFDKGVKQIVIPQEDKGPEKIDRCTSCHVALKYTHFSPTAIARDINGNMMLDERGRPILEKNEDYIWALLDRNIEALKALGKVEEAEKLEELKTGTFDEIPVNMDKVLVMHPLMGQETRPLEFHPPEKFACIDCHNGNGRGLTLKTAHGPIYDGLYEAAHMGVIPKFTEIDDENDPKFSKVFNHKPDHDLLFQTTPLFVGALMQSSCVQCHKSSDATLVDIVDAADAVIDRKKRQIDSVQKGLDDREKAIVSILELEQRLEKDGYDKTIASLQRQLEDYTILPESLDEISARLHYLKKKGSQGLIQDLDKQMLGSIGSPELLEELKSSAKTGDLLNTVKAFIQEKEHGQGLVFKQVRALATSTSAQDMLKNAKAPLEFLFRNGGIRSQYYNEAQLMMPSYDQGKHLFFTQACYACHEIKTLSRGGVGPELTAIGLYYPWFIKESIVWPQADLKTSTMPNFHLDHDEVERLMTFLLAQKGVRQELVSDVQRDILVKEWEQGKKMPWEKPVGPTEIFDVRAGMKIYATEGCASCHKLMGFESDVGFAQNTRDESWFYTTFPEQISPSQLVQAIDENGENIDKSIVSGVFQGSLLEEIDREQPETIDGFYTNFKFAARAKNTKYQDSENMLKTWKERVYKVRQMYIQMYGLGRDIAPRLNWSGVYSGNEWIYGHFKKPEAYTPRSLMPVFPLDDTKFYSLTNMLHVLGKKNRDTLQHMWEERGFDPSQAFDLMCSSCHGAYRHGNGPIAEWIYPIPKNLRDVTFLRNLTKERAIESITYGVKGTPMPPWGSVMSRGGDPREKPVLSQDQIRQLVDWLYSDIPDAGSEKTVDKWQYTPEKVVEELKNEGEFLKDSSAEEMSVLDIFKTTVNPNTNLDKTSYFIKEDYCTEENLSQGRRQFLLNCSECHGNEAAGNGSRAEAMQEAKPRMLSNLAWISTRDDLRLLRSIKYGVSGTAMTMWGDKLSAVQRMQIVIFLRHLTKESSLEARLNELLFAAFNEAEITLEQARVAQYKNLESARMKYQDAVIRQEELITQVRKKQISPDVAARAYEKQLALMGEIQKREEYDAVILGLIDTVLEEKGYYAAIGTGVISRGLPEDVVQNMFAMIQRQDGAYLLVNGVLQYNPQKTDPIREKKVAEGIENCLVSLKKQEEVLKAKFTSRGQMESLASVQEALGQIVDLKTRFVIQLERIQVSKEKQQTATAQLHTIIANLNQTLQEREMI